MREKIKERDSQDHRAAGLLSSMRSITNPDLHSLNRHCERNDRLLHAVLCAYAKHHLDCEEIGWNELGDILLNVICNEIGDQAFVAWAEMISGRDMPSPQSTGSTKQEARRSPKISESASSPEAGE